MTAPTAMKGHDRAPVVAIAGYRRGSRSLLTLQIDPTRAALAAVFELRTGVKIEAALLDALDDLIFNTGRSEREGGNLSDQPARANVGG